MADVVTIGDLIRNGTMSASMAATMWAAMDRRMSVVTAAIPRLAGKTTTTSAILSLLPADVPIHRLSGEEPEMIKLKETATGGYLVVGEFSQGPVPTYIWGAPVRRVFDTMTAGYSLATTLHASGVEEAFDIICRGNGVSDESASRVGIMLYIRRFGNDMDDFWRRVAEIHEVDAVNNGRPHGRLLYRWLEDVDRFESVETPRFLNGSPSELAARTAKLEELAASDLRSDADVAKMVEEYRRAASD